MVFSDTTPTGNMDLAPSLGMDAPELVSFVGAGGKKTAMAELVEEAIAADRTVAYTTTTHMPPPSDLPLVLHGEGDATTTGSEPFALADERVADPERADEKVSGLDPATIDGMFEDGSVDWLLVKADGARRREFKAPGSNEPVIPDDSTSVVVVASVASVGKPLAAPTVHRPERVADIADATVGEPVTVDTMASVLASDDGGCKGIPEDARAVVLVNKADTAARREKAQDIVRRTLDRSSRFDGGLVTSFTDETLEVVSSP